MEKVFVHHHYLKHGWQARRLLRRYLEKITGLSPSQMTQLIQRYRKTGNVACLFFMTAISPVDMEMGRRARDHADVKTLQLLVNTVQADAAQQNSAAAYEKLAQLDLWLCEIGRDNNNGQLVKTAAQEGRDAANKAVVLNDGSSEAHRLEGELLGEMIPHVFMGGVRYGPLSSKQLDKAIELDPRNANAYIARGVNYFYTPAAFGGGHDKAIAMLRKAIEVDSTSDSAHLWLAQIHLENGNIDSSFQEITEARRINSDRSFTNHLYEQIVAKKKSSGR